MKTKLKAYILLWIGVFGICGLHRFYLGKTGTGILWLLTFGLLGIGQLIDMFTLGNQVEMYNINHGYTPHIQPNSQGQNQAQSQNIIVNVTAPTQETPSKESPKLDS